MPHNIAPDTELFAQDEVRQLRRRLFELILQRDRLIFVESRLLEQEYLRLFSAKECAIYDLNTKLICQERRRALLAQGLDEKAAEEQVARAAEYRHRVWLSHIQYRNLALQNDDEHRDKHWFDRLDHYYALAVRLIHPELFPTANERQRQLMLDITRAYKEHNLPHLALQPEQLQFEVLPRYDVAAMGDEELAVEKARLLSAIQDTEELIKKAELSYPNNLRPLLQNPAACAAKLTQLDELLADLNQRVKLHD